jgi:glycosyltransferase involved in cell wall biosynthesis
MWREPVQSVLAQTYGDFELLIVDDGGQDRSVAICAGFDDPRIRILPQTNRGLAGARNTGILAARGNMSPSSIPMTAGCLKNWRCM